MREAKDRLYKLLPAIYRQRDAEQGYPLKALLQVISEQVNIVEDDIFQLYENWFIETAQNWAVPYIGDLVGYRPVFEAGEPGNAARSASLKLNKILFPRREIANAIGYRRRKGTLALLEQMAKDISGWPTRAVEFYRLLRVAQHVNHLHLDRGSTADMRWGYALERLDGPFDELAHTVDARRINSHQSPGKYNIPNLGLFVWRLKPYSVTKAPIYNKEGIFKFNILGKNVQLFTKPIDEPDATHIADKTNVPDTIRRRAFEEHLEDYYGEGKSLCIWRGSLNSPVPLENIIPADLSGDNYTPENDDIAVDPELGKIAISDSFVQGEDEVPLWISYHYGFSSEMGGGEYIRELRQRPEQTIYRVGREETLKTISQALQEWKEGKEGKRNVIIEIEDSDEYREIIELIELEAGDRLELRAANGSRPVIRLLNQVLKIEGKSDDNKPSYIILNGIVIANSGIKIAGKITEVTIRHCTLVPGRPANESSEKKDRTPTSLHLANTSTRLVIEHSILGYTQIDQNQAKAEPLSIRIEDSILDATDPEKMALDASNCPVAHARLTILRSTVLGEVQVHAIDLADNCIFFGKVTACRLQKGCMRFCYVMPLLKVGESRTPRRYQCQPDLAEKAIEEKIREEFRKSGEPISEEELNESIIRAKEREAERVRPQFNSTYYGKPDYCQLADACAEEIKRGADDRSEMGAFHDLFQPQREANLRARLEEYTPAGTDADIIFVN